MSAHAAKFGAQPWPNPDQKASGVILTTFIFFGGRSPVISIDRFGGVRLIR